MSSAGFEPAISAGERPQTDVLRPRVSGYRPVLRCLVWTDGVGGCVSIMRCIGDVKYRFVTADRLPERLGVDRTSLERAVTFCTLSES